MGARLQNEKKGKNIPEQNTTYRLCGIQKCTYSQFFGGGGVILHYSLRICNFLYKTKTKNVLFCLIGGQIAVFKMYDLSMVLSHL